MGTRSITRIQFRHAGETKPVATFYRQYDGYPEGHGLEMARILAGFGKTGDELGAFANGHDDMAFQFLALLKSANGPYNLYLTPVGEEGMGEEYVYTVTFEEERTLISFTKVYEGFNQSELTPAEFIQQFDPTLQDPTLHAQTPQDETLPF